jgi:thiosulfate reductase cytochrome b subunit
MQKNRLTHVIMRHPLVVRITHWVIALSLFVLAMSGMQIFNAHPALYASDASNFSSPILLISGETDAQGNPHGWVQIGRVRIPTTHVLGWGDNGQGGEGARAFPGWATIPSEQDLADGRRWHIFFAWIFVLCALVYARFAVKLIPTKADFKALPHTLKEHLKPWKIPPSAELNPMQKLAYGSSRRSSSSQVSRSRRASTRGRLGCLGFSAAGSSHASGISRRGSR